MRFGMALLVCLLGIAATVAGDTFHLGEGKSLRGKVLKETSEHYFVDIGFTVVSVPKKSVLRREDEGAAKVKNGAVSQSSALYSTIDREEMSVKENVARTAQAVVRIQTPSGSGSGFIITPDGYIITNDHVVQGDTKITVILFLHDKRGALTKRKIEKVKIVATTPDHDLALLKIAGEKNLPIVYLGDSDKTRVGSTVYAIGNPLGLERTVSEGIISTRTRVLYGRPHIQTTTPINPGNSGGPLFNLKGQVIGIVDLGGVNVEGLNFAIPSHDLKRFLKEREAYSYDKDHPNSGYRYLPPPVKPTSVKPPAR